MHLALLTPEWFPGEGGGIATYCRILATRAARLGHEITVLAAARRPSTRTAHRIQGVRVNPVPVAGLGAAAVAERFVDAWKRLVAQGVRPDAHEVADFGGVGAFVAEAPQAQPLFTRLHTPLALLRDLNGREQIYPDDEERCRLEEKQVRASTALTSPSNWLAEEVTRLWRLREIPQVIPNPAPPRCHLSQASRPRRPGPVRVLYFGRMEYRKGLLVLAEAVRLWLDRAATAEITFVGGDTKWRGVSVLSRVKDLLGPYGKGGSCRFLPPRTGAALRRVIDDADLLVLPSLYENFPYTCLEAMARAKPVLATTGTGYSEILDHLRTGFLVGPGDAEALARALAHLCADFALLEHMGREAWRSLSRFSAPAVVSRLCDAYNRAASLPVRQRALRRQPG
jgi:glycogen(starch) synthase